MIVYDNMVEMENEINNPVEGHGYHAEIEMNKPGVVTKRYHLDFPEAGKAVLPLIIGYQEALKNAGLPVGEISASGVDPDGNITLVMPHLGISLDKIVREGGDLNEINSLLEEYFRIVAASYEEDTVAVDPPLANVVIGEGGDVWYVDLFPPRMRVPEELKEAISPYILGNSGLLTEFSNGVEVPEEHRRFLEWRYYGGGFSAVVAAQVLRQAAQNQLIRGNQDEFLGFLEDQFNRHFPDFDLDNIPHPNSVATPFDCDLIRVVAGRLCLTEQLSPEQMNEVFGLTHIHPGGILPSPDQINQALGILNSVRL